MRGTRGPIGPWRSRSAWSLRENTCGETLRLVAGLAALSRRAGKGRERAGPVPRTGLRATTPCGGKLNPCSRTGTAEGFLTAPALEIAANVMAADSGGSLSGREIGSYQILSRLGEGGMGEVFRARDTKLNRDVALKVLPDPFASDPDRLARFTREAQTLASLNHPNIAHIHGLEESGGVTALVMELVEGEDAVAADRPWSDSTRGGAANRQADRRGARSRARAGDHPSRPEAGEHQGPHRRHGEGARLRPREGVGARGWERRRGSPVAVADDHEPVADDRGRHDSRHGRVHEPGAGAREARGQTRGHLGVRLRAVRDADVGNARSAARTSPTRSPTC